MEYFSLFLDGLCLAGQGVLHIIFVARLTGKRPKIWHFAAYLALLCLVEGVSAQLLPGGGVLLPMAAGILVLYGVSRLGLKNRPSASWMGGVLAFYISQLSFGIVNAGEALLFPPLIGSPLLYPMLLAALAAFFGVCVCCYAAAERCLSLTEETPCLGLVLFPVLFFFGAELYILRTAYSYSASPLLQEAGKHSALLLLQGMGLAALLCTLHAYRRLCQGFQAQGALQSLSQAVQAQKVYIAEARRRYEQTRSFRHDIKNHLSVLDGLLGSGRTEEGRAYLKKLETVSEGLSFPYQTGSPVVDILLGEKLGLAKGVTAEVSLRLPNSWGVDDFDLCVIFANALDNALRACPPEGEAPSVRITGKRQGDFYLLKFENACDGGPMPPAGTGLSNIRAAAEKYRGAVLTEKAGGRFSLSVLLNIS